MCSVEASGLHKATAGTGRPCCPSGATLPRGMPRHATGAHPASVLAAEADPLRHMPAARVVRRALGNNPAVNATVLWVIAVVIAIVGIVQLLQGQIILGIILLIAAAAVGPGGWSLFKGRAAR